MSTVEFDPSTVDLAGLTVIEASAGTGKTYAIQKLVRRLVIEGVPMSRLLVMSYTEAAAAELSERLRVELVEALETAGRDDLVARGRLERAISEFDTAAISTIHAFCLRMLQEHPAEAGPFGLQGWSLEPNPTEAQHRACLDAWGARLDADPDLAKQVDSIDSVQEGLAQALRSDHERKRVLDADPAKARAALLEACVALHDARCVASLQAVADRFNKEARDPAAWLVHAVGRVQVGAENWLDHGGTLLRCSRQLTTPAVLAKATPAKARAEAKALLDSPDWQACSALLARVAEASERLATEALRMVVGEALRRLVERRRMLRQYSFDDLIQRLAEAVACDTLGMREALRERFDVVIVDEVQDTDPAQASILRRAFVDSPRHRTILVGDPKQSIYGFRRADVDSYIALRGLSGKPIMRLNRSRRSDVGVIRGVQAVFGGERPFQHEGIEAMDVDSIHPHPRLRLKGHSTPGLVLHEGDPSLSNNAALESTAHAIADELRAGWLVHEGDASRPLRPADVAVLCHTHWQGAQVVQVLRSLGVPVTVIDRSSVFESEAAEAIAGLLAAMAQPRRRELALGALASRVTGMRAVDAIERPEAWLSSLRAAQADLERFGVAAALHRLTHGVPAGGGRLAVLRQQAGERFATDFDHVVEALTQAEADGVRGAAALADWLAWRVQGGGRGDQDNCRSLGSLDAVTVMTIHGSKGLTFGVAWLPTFLFGSKQKSLAPSDPEARRLLYVAMTRARYRTHLVWRGDAEADRSPFAELVHGRACSEGESVAQRLADPARGLLDLRKLAASEPAAIECRALVSAARAGAAQSQPIELLAARSLARRPDRSVVLSFTSLSRAKHAQGDGHERDVGQTTDRAAGRRDPVAPLDGLLRDTGLHGAALGVMVHDALAHADAFACLAAGATARALSERLAFEARGLRVTDPASLERLALGLQRGLAAPTGDSLIPDVARLATNPSRSLRELALTVPWLGAPADLADALRDERAPWSDAVAEAIGRADRSRLQGVLIGFVDLVALHAGQWFIYDYKTNHLGDDGAAYEGERLHQAMADALYPLQAAVYALMLARWLESRGIPDAFDGAIGGVAYLFLRGMDPATGSRGTWTWRPSPRLLRALDAALPRRRLAVEA